MTQFPQRTKPLTTQRREIQPTHPMEMPGHAEHPGQLSSRVHKGTPTNPTAPRQRASSKHKMGACCACKARKKKCDGQYPVCGNCLDSGQKCTIVDLVTSRVIPRNYVETLERRVHRLEHQLSEVKQANPPIAVQIRSITLETPPGQSTGYIGESTKAYSIASAITSTISYYDTDQIHSPEDNGAIPTPTESHSDQVSTLPDEDVARHYLDLYYNHVQCQYPFLNWEQVCLGFDSMLSQRASREEAFFGFMILAIGSQINQDCSSTAARGMTKAYYLTALANVPHIVDTTSLMTVQAYLMLSVFSQKMPDASSIWQTIGLAIRTSVILGLHRDSNLKGKSDQELRKKIFWCCYCIERINGITLGRPFGISDADIDIELPVDNSEFGSVFCHLIKLRRLQSRIHTTVCTLPKNADMMRIQLVLELKSWLASFPRKDDTGTSSVFETNSWAKISYHNSIVHLLRPVIFEISSSSGESKPACRLLEWFKTFTKSSSLVVKTYLALYHNGMLSYTMLALQTTFVSGLSFLYCVWLNHTKQLNSIKLEGGDLDVLETMTCCSTLLSAFSQKFENAVHLQEIFNRVSRTVMRSIGQDPDEFLIENERPDTQFESPMSSDELIRGTLQEYTNLDSDFWKSSGKGPVEAGAIDSLSEVSEDQQLDEDQAVQESTELSRAGFFLSPEPSDDTFLESILKDLFVDADPNVGI